MAKISRKFQPGDERSINNLYHMVAGISRSKVEYAWEWLKTWDGPSSIWLTFDDTRKTDDQLIGQYSLIPTPFSFWGKQYLAGKTENCMSHPDFRGKGMYFFHEKKYFEHAKDRFQLFFTTTGDVARGAPGKVRMKLGYRPFDHWVTYSYWLDKAELSNEILSKLPTSIKKRSWLSCPIVTLLTRYIMWQTRSTPIDPKIDIRLHAENEAPLDQIERLWRENAELYGITVDRTAKYLKWRINDNPYLSHNYLCYYEANVLQGYLIYSIEEKTTYVLDILAGNKSEPVFLALLDQLKVEGRRINLSQVKCYTSSKNKFLIDILQGAKHINFAELFTFRWSHREPRPTQIFIYVSDDVKADHDIWDSEHWYITDLVKEGRPYAKAK